MRRIILVTLLLSLVLSVNLAWGAAEQTYLKSRAGDGAVLTLGNGSVWEVAPAHRDESADWQTGDRITIMESKDCLYNVNKGESVDARPLQPHPPGYGR
jgi:hypothetical protein